MQHELQEGLVVMEGCNGRGNRVKGVTATGNRQTTDWHGISSDFLKAEVSDVNVSELTMDISYMIARRALHREVERGRVYCR